MTTVFVSVVVYDASDLRVSLFRDEESRRLDLLAYFNDTVEDGGLDEEVEPLPDDATTDEIVDAIDSDLCRVVYLEENCLS